MSRRSARRAVGRGLATALLAIAVGGCGDDEEVGAAGTPESGGGGAPRAVKVDIVDGRYRPKRVRVAVGGTVTWINRDDTDANTAETDPGGAKGFDTHVLFPYETKAVRMDEAGRFRYHSSLDPNMRGVVEVVE